MPADVEGILITGGAGWIGSRLGARLMHRTQVSALSRADLDCADRSAVVQALAEIRPATIVHLVGSTAARLDPRLAEPHWRDTFHAGRNVVEVSADAGTRHVIMAGTIEELGDAEGTLTIDTPARPRTTYGLCKSLLREVAAFVARDSEVRVDWFRPCIVYGPGQRGQMLVPTACEAAISGRPTPFTDGRQHRDFLFVEDLLDWLELAIDSGPEANGELNLHHLGTGEGARVADILAFIQKALPTARFELGALPRRQYEPSVQIVPLRPSSDPILGRWRATTSWQEGLGQTTAWWSAQPVGTRT